ncbi:MAG: hypothetical protein SFU83_11595 [Meiothermus sp.]|nr:hypothetical protein [Meiothermus sp.]
MNATLEQPAETSAAQSVTCLPRERMRNEANLSQVWAELLEMYDLPSE